MQTGKMYINFVIVQQKSMCIWFVLKKRRFSRVLKMSLFTLKRSTFLNFRKADINHKNNIDMTLCTCTLAFSVSYYC